MLFKQLNLNKSKNACDILCHMISKSKTETVYLLQEPYRLKNGRVPGVPRNYLVFGEKDSRAIIIAPKNSKFGYCPEFSSKDISTCLLVEGTKKWYITSLYLDQKLDPIHPTFNEVVNFATVTGEKLIIGADTNAWSPMWNSNQTNQRGEILEDYIMSNNIDIENKGNIKTFLSRIGSSIIDVTFTMNMPSEIQDWHVISEYQFSDHRVLTFSLPLNSIKQKAEIDMSKCNWETYAISLPKDWVFVDNWSIETIESEALNIEKAIQKAIKVSCPLKVPCKQKVKWYSTELHLKKMHIKKLAHRAWGSKKAEDWDALKSANADYRNKVRKAKRAAWQEFCSSIETPNNMARLHKIISKREDKNITLLKNPEGGYTRSPMEVANVLLDTHFPKSENVPLHGVEHDDIPCGKTCYAWELKDSFITEMKVKEAFKSFGPTKSAGLDQIKPCFLTHLNESMISRITWLYRACIKLGYTPKSWRTYKILFMAKPGKDDYSNVRSWRALSLSSFLYKTLERINLWYIEENILSINPIDERQHGFKKGRSCDTILSSFIDDVESSILRGQYALAIMLDIQGCFDNIPIEIAIEAMVKKNFPEEIWKWQAQYLRNRYIVSDILGHSTCRKLKVGCGQGLVLSPLIWSLVFDSFLELFNTGPIRARAYCDDGSLVVSGPDPSTLVSIMEKGLEKVLAWGNQHKLIFSPAKTVAMIFHRENKFKEPRKVKMGGVELDYSLSARYLGIYLDSKLLFKEHLTLKIKKAKQQLILLKQSIGARWGPHPKVLRWAYQGIVIPSLSFGSVVWSKICHERDVITKLTRLNRLAALLLMPIRKKTPTHGLEVILNLPPLDLKVKELALKAYMRVKALQTPMKWDGVGKNKLVLGHLKWCQKQFDNLGINPEGYDKTYFLNLDRKYNVDLESKNTGLPISVASTQCYTDGSRMNERSGYGLAIIQGDTEISNKYGYLGKNATVFQSEVYAIHKACVELSKIETDSVTIFTDSQSTLDSLKKVQIKSKVVKSCILELNKLSQRKSVEIKWVKAHFDHTGNELADALAKNGTTMQMEEQIPPPLKVATRKLEMATFKAWNQRWIQSHDCRQTKQWFPTLDKSKSERLVNLDRSTLGLVVQLITGFNGFMYHESNIAKEEVDSTCRLCLEDTETSWHIVCECPALWRLRREIFNTHYISKLKWSVKHILNLVKNTQVKDMLKGIRETNP